MSTLQERIEQWEKMTLKAPDGMAWLSLGNTYIEARRLDDAATALSKAIEHDPSMSRAYQAIGEVLIQLEQSDKARPLLLQGYAVAAERGDRMPQKAIGAMLEKLGVELPQVQAPKPKAELTGEQMIDRRTGQQGTRMADQPMRGPLGAFIQKNFSQETWREWISQGTKVINELRLDFSRDDHQKIYDQQMFDWLGITEKDVAEDADS